MWPHYGWQFAGPWFFAPLLMVVILGLVVWGIVIVARGRHHHPWNEAGSESAIDILKKRYASGEITKEEFEAKRKDILG